MANTKIKKNTKKEYVVIYQSEEHYEVLGYVRAASLEEAKKKAQLKLLPEAKYYKVAEAEIDEIAKFDTILFGIKINEINETNEE